VENQVFAGRNHNMIFSSRLTRRLRPGLFHQHLASTFSSNKHEHDGAERKKTSSISPAPLAAPLATSLSANVLLKHGPGVAAAATVMTAGFFGAEHLGQLLLSYQGITGASSPISGIPVSILLGMAVRNMPGVTLPEVVTPGLKFSTTTILRSGIICVGAKLSALEMISLGVAGVPVVALSIATGIGFVTWFGPKMGLTRKMTSLIAAGTSICKLKLLVAFHYM
jgi:hypothetical protein